MTHSTTAAPAYSNVADLIEHLGNISPERIRLRPAPGQATEKDVIEIESREGRLCELVDGILVEKPMGIRESCLAAVLIRLMGNFVEQHDLGIVTAPDGTLRLAPGLVRIPDVAFIAWSRLPGRHYPDSPIPDLAPDLAVEVLSEGNTPQEMQRKLKEYFFAGTRLVWFVDPDTRTAQAYTAPDQSIRLTERQVLNGEDVLPGFRLPLTDLFAHLKSQPRTSAPKQSRKGKGKR